MPADADMVFDKVSDIHSVALIKSGGAVGNSFLNCIYDVGGDQRLLVSV